jgi:hypothetical protein
LEVTDFFIISAWGLFLPSSDCAAGDALDLALFTSDMAELVLEIFTFSTTLGLAFPGDDSLLFKVDFCLTASWILAGTFSLVVTAFLIISFGCFGGVLACAWDLVPLNSFFSATTVLEVLKDLDTLRFDKDFVLEFCADLVAEFLTDLEAELLLLF